MSRIRFKYNCLCEKCGETFLLRLDNIKLKTNLHCRSCRYDELSNKYKNSILTIWNKGNHVRLNTGRTHIKKGQRLSPETEFRPRDKHVNWKGGIGLTRGSSWDKIRRSVSKRDKNICKYCGENKKLNCHHIIPYRLSNNNAEDNLITLCHSCHSKLEMMYENKCERPKYFGIVNNLMLGEI